MFHAHFIAKAAFSKLMRNGKEIDYLFENKWYDPNYQYYSYFPKRINVLKGDDIKVSCNFSTSTTNFTVKGGITARDEMCQVLLMYYPRNPEIVRCKERFELNTWKDFLISLNRTGEINLTEDVNTLTMSNIPQSILNANFTESLVRKFQAFESNAKRTQICQSKLGFSNATLTYDLLPLKTTEKLTQVFSCDPGPNSKPLFLRIIAIVLQYFASILEWIQNHFF
jgi:hypothetical protein